MIATLLGLDIGTTSTKAVLFDLSGTEIARDISAPYPVHTPHPGWIEQDPEEIWQAVLSTIRGVLAKAKTPCHVLALCMAAQSGSLVPVNTQGNPVYRLITWMDGRTAHLVSKWREEGLQKKVKAISGWSLYPGLCLPTIAWLEQNMPEVFKSTRHFLSLNDFITFRLTGLFCTNPSNGGGMQLVDIQTGEWSDELCHLAGISPDQLSTIQPAATVVGKLLPSAYDITGLSSDTLLVNGGHDQGCTAVGLGVISPGRILLACGTAWVITGVTTAPDIKKIPAILDLNFHPAPGRWTISQSLGGLGAALEWWGNQAWNGTRDQTSRETFYATLNEELTATMAGSDGLYFLPVTGGHTGPATVQKGGFIGLQLGHTRADMARAILEGAAFELKWSLDMIQAAGLPVDKLWMVGGAAKSPLWPGILAGATKKPVLLPQYDNWPALGAAVLAGLGTGIFDSIEAALNPFQKPTSTVKPDLVLSDLYRQRFDEYRQYVMRNESLLFAN